MHAKLYFDGSSLGNPGPSGGGAVLEMDFAPFSKIEVAQHIGHATCNEAEYQGLICGLHEAIKVGVKQITIHGDSQLVVNQVNGTFKTKNHRLMVLLREVHALLKHFDDWTCVWVPREQNKGADRLAGWSASVQVSKP